jgi:DNA modification methylase
MPRKPKTERNEEPVSPANPPQPELRTIPITNLLPDEKNPRKDLQPADPEYQKIKTSIEQFQFLDPIVFNSRTHMIIGGHQRLKILRDSGITDLFVLSLGAYSWAFSQADLTEMPPAMETAANIALNKASGDWDTGRLVTALESIKIEGLDINITGFNEKELVTFMADLNKGKDPLDSEPQISRAEELRKEWGTELGQLWQCGDHRVICGDCTDPVVINRLMGDEKADMVFTDPPYNIDYGNIKHPKFKIRQIENDSMPSSKWITFCESIAKTISLLTKGCIYVCHAPGEDGRVMAQILDSQFHSSTTIIWNKDVFTLGRGKYQNKYEPIWFGWVENGSRFCGDRNLTNVWDVARPKSSKEHPTMKPIPLVILAISHASTNGDVVSDPFLGSGTTMIACENLGRRCRGCEIDPGYVAVILQRYKDTFPDKEIRLVKE